MNKILIMCSGNGTNFEQIVKKIYYQDENLDVELILLCNKVNAPVISKAQKYNVTTYIIDDQKYTKQEYNQQILELTNKIKPTIIVLSGYMKILPQDWTSIYGNITLNLHPSLLPSFKGAHAIVDTFEYGCKVGGITIHLVDHLVDNGQIVFQKSVDITPNDTLQTYEEKIKHLEHKYFTKIIKEFYKMNIQKSKVALMSLSDKTNCVWFAKQLNNKGYQILATGNTFKVLEENQIDVISIEDYSNFEEILDGRVKTLQPIIHGGILAQRDNKQHQQTLKDKNWKTIDLVCVNLYPFESVSQNKNASFEEVIENIDIGGVSLIRSGAKNYRDVIVVTDPVDYDEVVQNLDDTKIDFKLKLANKAFLRCSLYNKAIYDFLENDEYPQTLINVFEKKQTLRYGENAHQSAALYKNKDEEYGVVGAKQLHGKELSYNNLIDANAAIDLICEFSENVPTILALKHTNPCGVASAKTLKEATQKCIASDSVSIFGGIVCTNQILDEECALQLSEIFLEIVIAPSFTNEALNILKAKKNLRILQLDFEFKQKHQLQTISGGALYMQKDNVNVRDENFYIVCGNVDENTKQELIFAQSVCKHVKSNAIVLSCNKQVIGVGCGQMNRINSLDIAIKHALKYHGDKIENCVVASDAFFPFDDCVKLCAKYNIKAIIQPGGSIRDEQSIQACIENNISMVFTNTRHFKH